MNLILLGWYLGICILTSIPMGLFDKQVNKMMVLNAGYTSRMRRGCKIPQCPGCRHTTTLESLEVQLGHPQLSKLRSDSMCAKDEKEYFKELQMLPYFYLIKGH